MQYSPVSSRIFHVIRCVLMAVLAANSVGLHAQPMAAPDTDTVEFVTTYKLGPGDIITIRVLDEPELSLEKVRVSDIGSVPMPAVGEINVLARTISEVERMVVDKLKGRILVNPKVSVLIEEYRPFFINGMVDKPGGYPFQPGLTVRKAAALAGGFKERASLKKIFLIREKDKTQTPVNVDLNTPVLPGDIVTVEESFF
ncbi:polysaccharide biosynthesis/export family protein [Aquabacterium sp.]|uniref:polysaccharide biosynthesis/export family protein n=1 Tax=Aquabacterium sp. TaxID=1872578 RepID=UPI0035AE86D9